MKKWDVLDKQITKSKKQRTIDDILKVLFANRGLTTKKEIDEFLHPSLKQLLNKDWGIDKREIRKTIQRIEKAINRKESIVVYTDYDADGICSGAILWETLHSLGAKVMPHVPHRVEEGYGLTEKGIASVKKQFNPTLMITVDHGISAGDEVDYANKCGIEVIILDHHLKPKKLPRAYSLIHTTQMAACGIVWIFCNYLNKNIQDKLDLVAMATIADMVPLTRANRIFTYFGLEKLNKTCRVGLNALIKDAGLEKGKIGVYEVSHILAPRINAMGRLLHALDSLRLVCTKDDAKAMELSRKLTLTNRERQLITQNSTFHAAQKVKNCQKKILIVADESYSEGVIGLIAARLVEEYHRPAIVIAKGKEYSKASARSVSGFNIASAIRKISYLLTSVGGHPMAAGFTIATKKISIFEKELDKISQRELSDDLLVKTIKIDTEISIDQISDELYEKIMTLSPFGIGNQLPTWVSFSVEVIGVKKVGKEGQHLKFFIRRKNAGLLSVIGFGMGNLYQTLLANNIVDIVYTLDRDLWNGKNKLQLKLKDVKLARI